MRKNDSAMPGLPARREQRLRKPCSRPGPIAVKHPRSIRGNRDASLFVVWRGNGAFVRHGCGGPAGYFGSVGQRPVTIGVGRRARNRHRSTAGRDHRHCICTPACGNSRTGRGGPLSPSACSVKPNKDRQQRPPGGYFTGIPCSGMQGATQQTCRFRVSRPPLCGNTVLPLHAAPVILAMTIALEVILHRLPQCPRQWRAMSSGRMAAGPRLRRGKRRHGAKRVPGR